MSVRRLADESVQPGGFAYTDANAQWAEGTIAKFPEGRQQSAVIPMLMRAQDQEGWVSRPAMEHVAQRLGMAYIRVLEVATFYTQFLLKPVGTQAHIQVCGTTPCMLRGAEELREVCQHKIHHDPLTTNEAGTLSWEEVECLGACVNAPMVAIFHDTYEDLTPGRLEEIIDAFAAGKGDTIKAGPQIARMTSAPAGGATTLTEEPTAVRAKFAPPPVPEAPAVAGASPVAATAAPQEPTQASKPREVTEESAPAYKGPAPQAKVSEAKAEGERKAFDQRADVSGAPNTAMREGAVGAESSASKVDGGRAPGKATVSSPGPNAASSGKAKAVRKRTPKAQSAEVEVNPVAEKGGAASPDAGDKDKSGE